MFPYYLSVFKIYKITTFFRITIPIVQIFCHCPVGIVGIFCYIAKPRTEPVRVHISVEKSIAPTAFDPVWGRRIWKEAIISFYQHSVPDGTSSPCCTTTASCKQTVCLYYNLFLVFPFYFHHFLVVL